jgi:hypothetical protein
MLGKYIQNLKFMPAPTMGDFFGTNATLDSTDATNPKLIIQFADFASVGWGSVAGTSDPEKWLTAIIKKIRAFSAANTDQVPNVEIATDPSIGFETRETNPKRRFDYFVSIYEPDTGATAPDPDNV